MDTVRFFRPGAAVRSVKGQDIRNGILRAFDVIIFPGGSGYLQYESLGIDGRSKVVRFVEKGGGFVGICAGAYLAKLSNGTSYGLGLARSRLVNRGKNWNRGTGIVGVSLTRDGKRRLPGIDMNRRYYFYYSNGPVFEHRGVSLSGVNVLMRFESDVYHDNRDGRGETPGTPFLLVEKHGRGMVVLASGHPEATPGMKWLLSRMISWSAGQRPVSVPKQYMKINKTGREIPFTKRWMAREERLLRVLRTGDTAARLRAMKELRDMGSLNLCSCLPTLLGDEHEVGASAAGLLKELECFSSVRALKNHLKAVKHSQLRKEVREAIRYLSPH